MPHNKQKPKSIREAIIWTLAYFDVFDYPPTFFEVWRHLLWWQTSLDEVAQELDRLVQEKILATHHSFYFFPGKKFTVAERQRRYDHSEILWRRATRAIHILSYMPFIQSIMVVNSLSFFNCRDTSDIDLLIITSKSKIWTTRALSTFLLHILGLRRHGKKTKGRICLSFYISEDQLNLDYIARDELGFFVALWIAQAAPILNKHKVFQKFWDANTWVRTIVPQAEPHITNYAMNFHNSFVSHTGSKILEIFLVPSFFEFKGRFLTKN